MLISNQNLRNTLRIGLGALLLVAIADVVLTLTIGHLTAFFSGYAAFAIPALVVGAYFYFGMPIFHFDAKSEVLHIKSHMIFGEFFGKEIYVLKKNIQRFEIKTERIRKKLTVYYLKGGKECSETFSIALLHNRKIALLAKQVELIQTQADSNDKSHHLFI